MDHVLDPELAAVAAALPKMDLSDLASAREAERLMVGDLPKYDARIPLSVQDIAVQQNTAAVAARVYALAERLTPGPTLLYLHGGAYVMEGVTGPRPPDPAAGSPLGMPTGHQSIRQ